MLAVALRESFRNYNANRLWRDLMAGITVGFISIPLAMALAIASGVPPQHGLYTSIFAGAVIAVAGGSRVNVSGPTAAFVVILLPVTQQFGLSGLLLATMMAGLILIAMGLSGLGRLVEYIPYPVTTGFTAGIAVVIASLQLKDFLGLQFQLNDAHFITTLNAVLQHLSQVRWHELSVALVTLFSLIMWPRLKIALPSYLAALVIGTFFSIILQSFSAQPIHTIATQFSFTLDGVVYAGIPTHLPTISWPWASQDVSFDFATLKLLSSSAFAMALLCAIESLLCAVIADGLSGFKHHSNGELIGQGLGNLIAPLFGGITATAAIARTAANVRSGASSPIAALTHAVVVLAALLFLAPWLAYIPMAALAALLLMVAWNMSDARQFIQVLHIAPRADSMVLLTCFFLTVLFDMVLAVEIGIVLAALLFIKRMTELSGVQLTNTLPAHVHQKLPAHVNVYDINGPLFFGAAEKAVHALWQVDPQIRCIILNLNNMPMMDLTGIVALKSLFAEMQKKQVAIVLCAVKPHILEKLQRASLDKMANAIVHDVDAASDWAQAEFNASQSL